MLRRFASALFVAAVVAACNSNAQYLNGGLGIGPTFASGTLYATNSTQNAVSIYGASPQPGATPIYQIGGTNTGLNAPQYLAFDGQGNLWVTNANAATGAGSIVVFKALATGNVLPLNTVGMGVGMPRGIAYSAKLNDIAVATTIVTSPVTYQILLYTGANGGFAAPLQPIGGPATGLNVPTGVAFDASGNIYVTNRGSASVEVFTLPSPTPVPSPSVSPSISPAPSTSPTALPSGATPTPSPTPSPALNLPPASVLTGSATGMVSPAGIAVDSSGTIYVADPGSASVRIFAPGASGNATPLAVIAGSNTQLVLPTDVKVDRSGNIYVADTGANKIFVFALNGATGVQNIAPKATLSVTGTVVGIGFSP